MQERNRLHIVRSNLPTEYEKERNKKEKKKDQPFQAAYLENPSKQDDDEPQEEAECHHGWEKPPCSSISEHHIPLPLLDLAVWELDLDGV